MFERQLPVRGDRSALQTRAAKPSELELAAPALPDGSSENFRFVPIPIERDSAGNPLAASAADAPATTCAATDDAFTPTQRLALSALICGGTLASAAARVGVSVRTLYKWRHQPAFAAELNRRSAEALEANCVRARNLMLKSTQVLAESLHGNDRYRWAMRLIQARNVWSLAQTLPAMPETSSDAAPGGPAQAGPTTTI